MLGMRLCVLHNLSFYNTIMTEIRDALDAGRCAEYKKQKLDSMATPPLKMPLKIALDLVGPA